MHGGSDTRQEGKASPISAPKIAGEYVNVYQPAGDVFPGPDAAGLITGRFYEEWIANDHCFVRDKKGIWHAFGITGPQPPPHLVHAGTYQSFHAKAPRGKLLDVLKEGSWTDLPKVLPAGERPGERLENHAPTIARKDGEYFMIYGPRPLRYATSPDLMKWTAKGMLDDNTQPGRDPSLLQYEGTYYLLTCDSGSVWLSTSKDLQSWDYRGEILKMNGGVDPESPTMVRVNKTFYLFVCGWNGIWDRKDLAGDFQYITYVYQSDDPFRFDANKELTRLKAHAPEIFQDERGDWYISSVEYPVRGVSIAPLVWE